MRWFYGGGNIKHNANSDIPPTLSLFFYSLYIKYITPNQKIKYYPYTKTAILVSLLIQFFRIQQDIYYILFLGSFWPPFASLWAPIQILFLATISFWKNIKNREKTRDGRTNIHTEHTEHRIHKLSYSKSTVRIQNSINQFFLIFINTMRIYKFKIGKFNLTLQDKINTIRSQNTQSLILVVQ